MLKTVLLIFFLIIVPFFSGRSLMLLSGIKAKRRFGFFPSFTAGTLVVICVSFLSHAINVISNCTVSYEKKIAGILMIAVMSIGYFMFVILTLLNRTEKNKKDEKSENDPAGKVFFAAAVVVSLFALCQIALGARVDSTGNEMLETVTSFLEHNVMYEVDPLTGFPYAEGLSLRTKLQCLPGLYAVLSGAFGTSPELLINHIIPVFWFLSGLFAIIALSGSVYSGSENVLLKRSAFVLFAVLSVYALDLSPYAQGFSVLSAMYSENAIRCFVLIPFMLYLLFEKKYITALFPVICEALICRTAYGAGFCMCIYAGFVIVSAVRRRTCSKT